MARILEGRNRATPDEAGSFVDQYEQYEREIDALKIEHMNKVRKVREKQSDLLDDAKSQGVSKKIVKTLAAVRKLEAKAKDQMEEMEADDKAFALDIRKALGDFADMPLGAAAVDREEGGDKTTAAIVDAVKASTSDEEWNEAGARAAELTENEEA